MYVCCNFYIKLFFLHIANNSIILLRFLSSKISNFLEESIYPKKTKWTVSLSPPREQQMSLILVVFQWKGQFSGGCASIMENNVSWPVGLAWIWLNYTETMRQTACTIRHSLIRPLPLSALSFWLSSFCLSGEPSFQTGCTMFNIPVMR